MKKILLVFLAFSLLFVFFGCRTDKPATAAEGGLPTWVKKARDNAPEDVLVGIGTAKLATTNQSMNTSESRARDQIVRAMNSIVKNMIEDYTASSEIDTSAAVAFQQQISVALAKATLSGARIVEQDADKQGAWWTVIYYNKSQAGRDINQAQAAVYHIPASADSSKQARVYFPQDHANCAAALRRRKHRQFAGRPYYIYEDRFSKNFPDGSG